MNNYTIYMHKNKLNGKIYIGQTSQEPKKRWDNGRGYTDCSRLYNAILKYGWDNFEHIILYQNLSQEEANILEEKLIKQYNTQNDTFGYNIKAGGANRHHSEETKRKIGNANKISLKGRKWTEHQREIISKMFAGEGNPFRRFSVRYKILKPIIRDQSCVICRQLSFAIPEKIPDKQAGWINIVIRILYPFFLTSGIKIFSEVNSELRCFH